MKCEVAWAAAARHHGRVLDPAFLLDADGKERLIARFGPGVTSWCDALPELAERYCRRWQLQLDTAVSGNTSRVFLGRQHGDRGVVLKLTPDRSIALQEALALRAWATTPHAVNLLDADLATGVLLLEKIEPGTKLSDQAALPAVREIADLLTGLRNAPSSDSGQVPTLAQGIESLFSRIGGQLNSPQVSRLVEPQLIANGHRLARELAGSGPAGLLHGDLHLSNILRAGPARGLVAIDPRPACGDLTFDAIDWALYRATSTDEIHERIERLCGLVPALDRDRLWHWCLATAAVIVVLQLRRRRPDHTTRLLLQLAVSI